MMIFLADRRVARMGDADNDKCHMNIGLSERHEVVNKLKYEFSESFYAIQGMTRLGFQVDVASCEKLRGAACKH